MFRTTLLEAFFNSSAGRTHTPSFPSDSEKEVDIKPASPIHISARQFGQRLVANQLENSSIRGQDSSASVAYWIEVVSLFLKEEGETLETGISLKHFAELKEILEDYLRLIRLISAVEIDSPDSENQMSVARLILEKLKMKLSSGRKIAYLPFGYKAGRLNEGHAIPLKFRMFKKMVEGLFLNLGEGAQMHPELMWNQTEVLYHFQSFPIHFDPEILFGPKGENMLCRQIRLQNACPGSQDFPYSAEDCYGPLWELGSVQSTFDSKLSDRAEPAQHGPICADMATLLIIKDVLIDLGYRREQIARFILNEKFCALNSFYARLERKGTYNEWSLLKKGIIQYAVDLAQGYDEKPQKVISAPELSAMRKACEELSLKVDIRIETLKPVQLKFPALETDSFLFPVLSEEELQKASFQEQILTPKEERARHSIPFEVPAPEKLLPTLNSQHDAVSELAKSDPIRASYFIIQFLLLLPVPDSVEKGYWDAVPSSHIREVLQLLSLFVCDGLSWREKECGYLNTIAVHTAYAIADKLARRVPEMRLEGFASPFYASSVEKNQQTRLSSAFFSPSFTKKKKYFEFDLIPFGTANMHWNAVRRYFEAQAEACSPTLFALHEKSVNITQGIRTLQSGLFFNAQVPSPESEHLSYLQQFFPKEFRSGNIEELSTAFAEVWLNEKGKALPPEYEPLYFLAYFAWAAFSGKPEKLSGLKGVVDRWKGNFTTSTDVYIFFQDHSSTPTIYRNGHTIIDSFRNWKKESENGENKAMCLQTALSHSLTLKASQEWRRIFSNPELRITSIIQWLRQNFSKLSAQHLHLIEYGLFEPGFLHKKIREEPDSLKQLRLLLRDGIDYFRKQELRDKTLFCLRTAILLESFVPTPDLTILRELEHDLLGLIEQQKDPEAECHHLLLLYRISLPSGIRSAAELVKARFYLKYYSSSMAGFPNWLVYESRFSFFLSPEDTAFSNPSWRKEVAEHVLGYIVSDFSKKEIIEDAVYPLIKYGDYVLDIQNCLIGRKSDEILVHVESNPHFKSPVWSSEGKLLSLDGNLMLKSSSSGAYILFAKIFIETLGPRWYRSSSLKFRLFENEQAMIEDDPFHNPLLAPPHLLIGDKCLVAAEGKKAWKIFQLRRGKKTGLVLADPQKVHADFFSRLAMEKEMRCWVNPETRLVEEIDLFEADLCFFLEKGKGYVCTQFPEYILAGEQSVKEINHYTGAFVLTNGSMLAVIIPAKNLRAEIDDFSPTAVPIEEYFSSKQRYFFYTVDQVAELLVSNDPSANLYLVFLSAKQRDYKKALRYLARAYSYERCYEKTHSFHDSLMQAFLKLKDESPEALAFYLHLALFYLENASQLIQGHYGKENNHHKLVQDVSLWAGKMYTSYIHALSSCSASPVPRYCRLTASQEIFLLSKLKPVLKKKDEQNKRNLHRKIGLDESRSEVQLAFSSLIINWVPSLEVRERLLNEGEMEKSIPKRSYPIQLSGYFFLPLMPISELVSELPPKFLTDDVPSLQLDFVRINLGDIRLHFPFLYERARNGEGVLDIYYIIRSAGTNGRYIFAYAALLHYIGNNPHDFSDLSFGEDREENIRVFEKITQRASRFYATLLRQATVVTNLYQRTMTFSYSNKTILALPPSQRLAPLKWGFSQTKQDELSAFSCEIYNLFLKEDLISSTASILPSDCLFAFDSYMPASVTENGLVETLRGGHHLLTESRQGKVIYDLKEESTLSVCLEKADLLLQKKRLELSKLKEETEECANRLPKSADLMFLRKLGQDLPILTMEGILTAAYEQKKPSLVQQANPLLTPKEVQQILFNTVKYHLLRIQIYQLEKAADARDSQAFGEALAVHTTLSPAEEPELYLFQSRSGKILWLEQAKLLEWYFEAAERHRLTLFAAPAGIGKTTLFQPIAMKWLARKGFFPVSVSPTPLYLVDREGLRSAAQQAYDLQIAVFELALSTEASSEDFQWLYEKLSQYQTLKGLKLTPAVYLALLLKYELALDCADVESVRWISLTLDLFKRKSVGLVDEGRQNASPFSQSEIGIGKPIPLPLVDRKVFIEIYRALTSGHLLEVVGLTRNLQATVDIELFPKIKTEVFRILADLPYFEIPEKEKKNVFAYWMGEREETEWLLSRVSTDQGRAIELVKVYFDEFFAEAMKCVGNMQHRPSLKNDEEIHVPARKKQATNAYFKEVYATLITTIQGTLQTGLNAHQAEKLLIMMKKAHIREVGHLDKLSEVEKELSRWLKSDSFRLSAFSFGKCGTVKNFTDLVARNSEAVLYYLEHCVLQQVTYCPEQLVVTPIHFLNAFQKAVLFSADPGPAEMYTLGEKAEAIRPNSTFLAHVIHLLALPQNGDVCLFPTFTRPLEFFEWLYKQKQKIFSDLKMIADAGGGLRDFSTEEIQRDFFLFLEEHQEMQYDGLILFAEPAGENDKSEQLLYLKGEKEPKVLKGNDIIEALSAHGLRWDRLSLLTFIDPSHCTGANIKQFPKARALLFLGEDLTLGDLLQAVMRLREFLNKQVITWGLSAPLARKIERMTSREIKPLTFLIWALQNEGTRIDSEILLSAYQQIAYLVENEARGELETHLNSPVKQIAVWKKHRAGFVSQYEWDPIRRFKIERREQKTEKVLLEFAEELYSRFAYRKPFTSLKHALYPIIENVAKRKPTLPSSDSFSMRRQVQQHTHQEQKTELDQISVNHVSITPSEQIPLPEWLTIDQSDFTSRFSSFFSPCGELFGSTGFTKALFLTHNLVQTAQTGSSSLNLNYLKPANYFLLIEDNRELCAVALSDEEASFFQKQLLLKEKRHRKIALLNVDGTFAQNGRGSFAFPLSVLTRAFVHDCVIDLGLLQCRLYHPLRFSERIAHWDDFWPMWLKIKKSQPVLKEIEPENVERLVPKHIQEGPKEERQSKSFFSILWEK